MNKLGYIVGQPTQFECPFYQFIEREFGSNSISVYYYNQVKSTFKDPEMKTDGYFSWGIDLLSNYNWADIRNSSIKKIFGLIKANDYIVVNGYANTSQIKSLIIAKILNKKIGLKIDTVLWNNRSIFKKLYKSFILFVLNKIVDVYWITGTKSKEYLNHFGISDNKIKYWSYVVDNDWFGNKSNLDENCKKTIKLKYNIPGYNKIITCIAKLNARESPIDIINSFHQLNDENATLMIIGDGNERANLEGYVKKELKNHNIIFTGYIEYVDLPQYYGISDLFIHSSINEPWGVSVQEAMACGLPVIASTYVGAGYDLIINGKNGFMYDYGNVLELKTKIAETLSLDRNMVRLINNEVLGKWNYNTTWKTIKDHIDSFRS